ncbi:MAG: hypothetical protein REI96_12215 [Flavobacterium nitrogenifigens]|uniref:hypothetical protein n=1 Tax=Flavobacterium nitrogenifigens TaxID=1617283 RepID=UPI0028092664|nr:hypothetical protein [Flavobacterium nitrogenifigens]MDQ8013208.1 hypothetical protein [Flavobacterium nitrogenifigens]
MKTSQINLSLLLLLSAAAIIVSKAGNSLLNVEELYYQSLSANLTAQQIEKTFEVQKKIQWMYYIIATIATLIKTMIISGILFTGLLISDRSGTCFNQVWTSVLKAEFIFVLAGIAKIVWFSFFQTGYSLQDLQYFYPLSILNIIGYGGLEIWFVYPLQIINLFEFCYIIFLALEIGRLIHANAGQGLRIVASTSQQLSVNLNLKYTAWRMIYFV